MSALTEEESSAEKSEKRRKKYAGITICIGCRDGSGRGGSDEHCGGECDAEPVAAAFGAARSEPGGARCAPCGEQDGISPPEGRRSFCFTVG